jgi:hypothetical protein
MFTFREEEMEEEEEERGVNEVRKWEKEAMVRRRRKG